MAIINSLTLWLSSAGILVSTGAILVYQVVMVSDTYGHTYKLILFGDGGVGKTSLAQRYLTGIFSERVNVTIGVEFYVKSLLIDGTAVKLQIWDFAGEGRFRFLLPRYCRGTNGGLFLYDVTNLASLHHLGDWLQVIRANAPALPVLVVGAKVDQVARRQVAREEATAPSRSFGLAGYVEVSAKSGHNVEETFESITRFIVRQEGGLK